MTPVEIDVRFELPQLCYSLVDHNRIDDFLLAFSPGDCNSVTIFDENGLNLNNSGRKSPQKSSDGLKRPHRNERTAIKSPLKRMRHIQRPLTGWTETFQRWHRIENGRQTSPISPPLKVGCTWRSSLIYIHAGLSAGQCHLEWPVIW